MSDEREQRNAVFGTPGIPQAASDPNIKSYTAAEKVKAEFGLDIPLETVPLPSGGKVYPIGSALHNRETIEIRAMTTREEDILTSKAFLKKGTVITELIRSCMVDKGINPLDLLVGDRNALMVAIRITGYGHEYDAEVECNECGVKSSQVFNLAQLPISPLAIDPVEEGTNQFEFTLPYSKKRVRFKFLTGRDEEEIMLTQERQKKQGIVAESSVSNSLFSSIIAVNEQVDRSLLRNFINNLPARDSLALRNYIRDNEPGIKMRQETICSSCGHAEEVGMPINTGFLWPGSR